MPTKKEIEDLNLELRTDSRSVYLTAETDDARIDLLTLDKRRYPVSAKIEVGEAAKRAYEADAAARDDDSSDDDDD